LSHYPWTPERELSIDQAAALVRSQFPEIHCNNLTHLGEGWDFFVFLVDDEIAFRFPKRSAVDKCIEREILLLDRLPEDIPIAVPRPLYQGVPGNGYPWHFWGYRMIVGEPLSQVFIPERHRPQIAQQVGEFLSILHATDGEGLPLSPWDDDDDDEPWHIKVGVLLEATRESYPASLFTRCIEYLSSPECIPPGYKGERRQVHADLLAGHILVDSQTFLPTGIIDWGDATAGDPAADFVGIWMWGGDGALEAALTTYHGELDPGARRRIRYTGTLIAMEDVHYATKTRRSELMQAGLATLQRELQK
jgi:aminoglycoside phosphotransferase (APT) family kinase protein